VSSAVTATHTAGGPSRVNSGDRPGRLPKVSRPGRGGCRNDDCIRINDNKPNPLTVAVLGAADVSRQRANVNGGVV